MTRESLAALRQDLQRPAGGWTMGFATLLGAMAASAATTVYQWLLPVAAILLLVHLLWGAAGYYPKGAFR
jgi:hypothetical protein